jgi:ubiquinone/menaquinone biosynthesis C-methylase UbiE
LAAKYRLLMSLTRNLYYSLPPSFRFAARRLYYLPTDTLDRISGRRDALTPPKGMVFTGSGGYREQGQRLFDRFVRLGGLQPQHKVLDIGSGIGRIAVPLTSYLQPDTSYEGFDVVKRGVHWCQKHISKAFPNFHFQYVSLNNDLYRSDGQNAASFTFPYPDQSFDFVMANSVFTHMLPEEVNNYMREIRRVLRPGGKAYASFFILNEESKSGMQGRRFRFRYNMGHYRLIDQRVKAANVAFEETYLKEQLIRSNGLHLENTYYGYWCGRAQDTCEDFQDFIFFTRAT